MLSTNITIKLENNEDLSFGTSVMKYSADKSKKIDFSGKTFIVSEKVYSTDDEVLFHHVLTVCQVEKSEDDHLHLPINLPRHAKFSLRENPQINIDDETYYILSMYKFYTTSAQYQFLVDTEPELLQKIALHKIQVEEVAQVHYEYFAGRLCYYIAKEDNQTYVLSFHYNKYGKLLKITENKLGETPEKVTMESQDHDVYFDNSKAEIPEILYKDFLQRGATFTARKSEDGCSMKVEDKEGSSTDIYFHDEKLGSIEKSQEDSEETIRTLIELKSDKVKDIKKISELVKMGTDGTIDIQSICDAKRLHKVMKDFRMKEAKYRGETLLHNDHLYFETFTLHDGDKESLYLPMTNKYIRCYDTTKPNVVRIFRPLTGGYNIADIEHGKGDCKKLTTGSVLTLGEEEPRLISITKAVDIKGCLNVTNIYAAGNEFQERHLIGRTVSITFPRYPHYEIYQSLINGETVFICKTDEVQYELTCNSYCTPVTIIRDLAYKLYREKTGEDITEFIDMKAEEFLPRTFTEDMLKLDLSKWLRESDYLKCLDAEIHAQLGM